MTESRLEKLEKRRLLTQAAVDAEKSQAERNRLGQFATPSDLASDMMRQAKGYLGNSRDVRFMDPAFGTGSFYSSMLRIFADNRVESAVGYEIDPNYCVPARELWGETKLTLHLKDFTSAEPPPASERCNLLICNPPYVRHHHIPSELKQKLKFKALGASGAKISGLAGLYCYFLALCHVWMSKGAVAGWLIPGEFLDVNYGAALKRYLLEKVTLLHVHRFDPDDVQFGDALVSSAVVWFRNEEPIAGHQVKFSRGGSLEQPASERHVSIEALHGDPKWTGNSTRPGIGEAVTPVLADFFKIKRGLATGSNNFFILSADEIRERGLSFETFRPILPSPRYLKDNEVKADDCGNPKLENQLYLLDCQLRDDEIQQQYPELADYLREGAAKGIANRYICRHRKLWYSQENRPPAPILCTYIGRKGTRSGRPFRFILNSSQATAANVYLMLYPKQPVARAMEENPALGRCIWKFLNEICPQKMLGEGRAYGGGLHKLEPRELGNVPVGEILGVLPDSASVSLGYSRELFDFEDSSQQAAS